MGIARLRRLDLGWGPSIKEVTWLSPRPFGVGTTREVALPGNLRVREGFIRWDEGSRYTFVVTDASMPALRRVAEDYVVEPDGDGALFRWTVAMEPRGALSFPFKVLSPAVKAAFGRAAKDGERYFATH